MGGDSSKQSLQQAVGRASSRVGRMTISGRYHKLPKKLEDDYDVEKTVLGSGYNGSVFTARNKTTGKKFAVKAFKLHGVSKEKKDELASECEIFLSMDHPHVARLVDCYEGEDQVTLVMECMEGGELFQRVVERKRFSEMDAADAVNMMLLAINYIHSHGVVHRDLKLENFLYESKDSDHLKLIDFGFSKVWEHNTKMQLSCGTLAYVAPEVLSKDYTSQCDLWSFGVIVFILLVGYMPFSGSDEVQIKNIKKGNYTVKQDKWQNISDTAQSFVKALLVVNPEHRLTADAALKHPFVASREKAQNCKVDQQLIDDLCSFGQASAFRRACFSQMAWSLSNEDRKNVRGAFLEMDKDRTGAIKLWEFKKVLEEQFDISDAKAVEVFKALDTNHTDEIHYSEFLAAMCAHRIGVHDELLKLTFKRFDTDNSGYITIENLKEVIGDSFDGNDINRMLQEADVAHDGKISLQDFMSYMRNPNVHEAHVDAGAVIIDKALVNAPSDQNTQVQPHAKWKPRLNNEKGEKVVAPSQIKVEQVRAEKGGKCGCAVS